MMKKSLIKFESLTKMLGNIGFIIIIYILTFNFSCSQIERNIENALPDANFVVSPLVGDTTSLIIFDASGSSDREDSTTLSYSWIFGDEKELYPDTIIFNHDSIVRHKYSKKGYYRARLLVKDQHGMIDSSFAYVNIVSDIANQAPNIPVYAKPADSAVNQLTTISFEWGCNDPENDVLTYDLYLGNMSDPPIYAQNLTLSYISVSGLKYNTTYYWRIGVFDEVGNYVLGPVWSFTTEN